jgi:hypothetical protein
VDTSGGNVTHTAVSFADTLAASEIVLHGADFSYPEGKLYARGTYLYSYFSSLERRTASLETDFSRMLLDRSDVTARNAGGEIVTYFTELLDSYRKKLIDLELQTPLTAKGGVNIPQSRRSSDPPRPLPGRRTGAETRQSWPDFCRKLLHDMEGIRFRPGPVQAFLDSLGASGRALLFALMPLAACHITQDEGSGGMAPLKTAICEARTMIEKAFKPRTQ